MGMDTGNNMTMDMSMGWTHMTFFWGSHSEILFKGWPGARTGMYVLALVVVFALSVLYEWVNHCSLVRAAGEPGRRLVQTGMHAVRVGLMYLVMLAVMSFNVGVLIVAIVGHAVGFLVFGSAAVAGADGGGGAGAKRPSLPPMGC